MLDVPALRLTGELALALAPQTLACFDGEPLARFLERQRWFSGKNATLLDARFEVVIPLAPSSDAALTRIRARLADGSEPRYQLIVTLGKASTDLLPPPQAVLAEILAGEDRYYLFDAAYEPAFRSALIRYVFDDREFTAKTARWRCRASTYTLELDPMPGSRVLEGEQSNTNIVYEDRVLVKLFRRLEHGENPDVELGRFLTQRVRFPHVPELLATMTLEVDGEPASVAGMAQAYIPGARDAWSWAKEELQRALAAEQAPAIMPLMEETKTLGGVTRGLHEALASEHADEAFVPKPADAHDVRRWAERVKRDVNETVSALERFLAHGSDGPAVSLGRAIVHSRDQLAAHVERLAASVTAGAGLQIRHHGDFHLAQVLRDQNGMFHIIDFEGEPNRPLADRRARQSPLRDVASMNRSFAYLAANLGAVAARRAFDLDVWRDAMRRAFIEGYLHGGPVTSTLLPTSWAVGEKLVALFELERMLYEVRYELASRPQWTSVPLRGIAAQLGNVRV